eukprot:jgi/Bigna1/143106/aug1.75_g17814
MTNNPNDANATDWGEDDDDEKEGPTVSGTKNVVTKKIPPLMRSKSGGTQVYPTGFVEFEFGKLVEEVMEITTLSYSAAYSVLTTFRWDKDKVFSLWFSEPSKVCSLAGVKWPRQNDDGDNKRKDKDKEGQNEKVVLLTLDFVLMT